MPFHCDDQRLLKWSSHQLNEYLETYNLIEIGSSKSYVEIVTAVLPFNVSSDVTQMQVDSDTGTYTPLPQERPQWALHPHLNFQSLSMPQLKWQSSVTGVHVPDSFLDTYSDAHTFEAPIVNCPEILRSHQRFVSRHAEDVSFNVEYRSVEEIHADASAISADFVVNCTGSASASLLSDSSIKTGRGCLKYFRRPDSFKTCLLADAPPIGSDDRPVYAIPRGDVVAVGGFYLEDDYEPELRPEENEVLDHNASLLLPGHANSPWEEVGTWVGFRPTRVSGVKLGVNTALEGAGGGARWIDNYGHGGSGWTVASGCAQDVCDIVDYLHGGEQR